MGRLPLGLVLTVAVGVAAGCGIVDSDPGRYEGFRAAMRKWTEHGIEHYEYVFQRSACECLPEWTRPYVIQVNRDTVVDVRDAETGQAAPQSFYPYTIPQLFGVIADALDHAAYVLIVEYDATLGYPTLISIDYSRQVADDEFTIRAHTLRLLR